MAIEWAELIMLLNYEPETGVFTWRESRKGIARKVNVAGSLQRSGYRYVLVNGRRYREHRLAWLYMTGSWPKREIDHINRVKDDNRFSNLREVSRSENMRNTALQSNNTSGVKGVYLDKRTGKWRAICWDKGKKISLGYYEYLAEADFVIKNFREKNHGEFCNHG